jgi:hypothetical protein
MNPRRLVAACLTGVLLATAGLAGAQPPPPPAGMPAGVPEAAGPEEPALTPPRVGFLNGSVSFWRPGADAWSPAAVNLPLAPGDVLMAGAGGTVEIQTGPQSFLRGSEGAQIALDRQEAGLVQYRLTGGYVALDRRDGAGLRIALAAPGLAVTVDEPGYYRLIVAPDRTTVAVHDGGQLHAALADGQGVSVVSGQEATLSGQGPPAIGPASPLTAWDEWNRARTASLVVTRAPYVPPAMYGTAELERYGTWRTTEPYGPIWVPAAVSSGWVPYSTGRWIYDPRFGWTWLDDAPWGWAPYHHGRWVYVDGYWAWAPGPVVVQPVYAPALVVFLGSPVVVTHRPLCWVALGWGEPVVPWWGGHRFRGHPSWHGWGGPRVVNHVTVDPATVVETGQLRTYRNQSVPEAVVAVDASRFGRGSVSSARIQRIDAGRLTPLAGAPPAVVTPASLRPRDLPATGGAQRSPGRSLPAEPRVGQPPARTPGPASPGSGSPGSSAPSKVGRPVDPPAGSSGTGGRWMPAPASPPATSGPGPVSPGAPSGRRPTLSAPPSPAPGPPISSPRVDPGPSGGSGRSGPPPASPPSAAPPINSPTPSAPPSTGRPMVDPPGSLRPVPRTPAPGPVQSPREAPAPSSRRSDPVHRAAPVLAPSPARPAPQPAIARTRRAPEPAGPTPAAPRSAPGSSSQVSPPAPAVHTPTKAPARPAVPAAVTTPRSAPRAPAPALGPRQESPVGAKSSRGADQDSRR